MISKRGLVLFGGSFAGVSTLSPMLATYASSKQFLAYFAGALGQEVSCKGIDVECVNTYFVVSNMSKIRKATMMIPMPRPYVKAVLAKIGKPCGALYTGRPNVSTPYWSHSLLDYAIVCSHRSITTAVSLKPSCSTLLAYLRLLGRLSTTCTSTSAHAPSRRLLARLNSNELLSSV